MPFHLLHLALCQSACYSVLVGRGDKKGPVVVWKPHSSCAQRDVLSLTTTQDFLLTGGRGEVRLGDIFYNSCKTNSAGESLGLGGN